MARCTRSTDIALTKCRALWEACRQLAAATGGAATFTRSTVASLEQLERSRGPLTGIVVAAGAAVGTIPETSAQPGPSPHSYSLYYRNQHSQAECEGSCAAIRCLILPLARRSSRTEPVRGTIKPLA